MPVPPNAKQFQNENDPTDVQHWWVGISRGELAGDVLMPGETVSAFNVAPAVEAMVLGVTVLTSAFNGKGRAPILEALVIEFWTRTDVSMATAAPFTTGAPVPIEVTLDTSVGRTVQKTVLIRGQHQ